MTARNGDEAPIFDRAEIKSLRRGDRAAYNATPPLEGDFGRRKDRSARRVARGLREGAGA